jgi:glycerol-3-phosphate dehydrogenase
VVADVDVAVVGTGVVGCAAARHLALTGASAVVLDRAADVGDLTSKANTDILHTGFDTVPGSLESLLVARGHRLLADYAAAAGVAVEHTVTLLLAWDDEQEAAHPAFLAKAEANGHGDARPFDAAEVRVWEPHLGPGARSGMSVLGEWVIDPWSVTLAFATEAVGARARLLLSTPVERAVVDAGHELGGVVRARWLVNAAGLGADRIDAGEAVRCSTTVRPRATPNKLAAAWANRTNGPVCPRSGTVQHHHPVTWPLHEPLDLCWTMILTIGTYGPTGTLELAP